MKYMQSEDVGHKFHQESWHYKQMYKRLGIDGYRTFKLGNVTIAEKLYYSFNKDIQDEYMRKLEE